MKKEMNNEVVEVKEEAKKITKQDVIKAVEIVGVGILSGIFGYKVGKMAKSVKVLKNVAGEQNIRIEYLEKMNDTLNAAASEGLYEEAIATVTRKINYLKDKIEACNKWLNDNPADLATQRALIKHQTKLDMLNGRKNRFKEAQQIYEIIED